MFYEHINNERALTKARIANLYADQADRLQKGGEGSKGGKIIGHTKSGKPIYESFDHASHADFSEHDHFDAADFHKKNLTPMHRAMGRTTSDEAESHEQAALKKRRDSIVPHKKK